MMSNENARVLVNNDKGIACLYSCDRAFGPIIRAVDPWTAGEVAEAFLQFLRSAGLRNLQVLDNETFSSAYGAFAQEVLPREEVMLRMLGRAT